MKNEGCCFPKEEMTYRTQKTCRDVKKKKNSKTISQTKKKLSHFSLSVRTSSSGIQVMRAKVHWQDQALVSQVNQLITVARWLVEMKRHSRLCYFLTQQHHQKLGPKANEAEYLVVVSLSSPEVGVAAKEPLRPYWIFWPQLFIPWPCLSVPLDPMTFTYNSVNCLSVFSFMAPSQMNEEA